MHNEVYIISAVRTPIGSFGGHLSSLSATELGAIAIKGALDKSGVDPEMIDEVIMGCVIQAGLGQAPARQAAIKADYAALKQALNTGHKATEVAASIIQDTLNKN